MPISLSFIHLLVSLVLVLPFSKSFSQNSLIQNENKPFVFNLNENPTRADIDFLRRQSDSLYDFGDYSTYAQVLDTAIYFSRKIGYKEQIIKFNRLKALFKSENGELRDALRLFEETLEMEEKWGFKDKVNLEYYNIGNTYLDLGHYSKALGFLIKSKQTYVGELASSGYLNLLNTLAINYENLKEPEMAKQYYDEFFTLAKQLQDTVFIAQYYINSFELFYNSGDTLKAESNLREAINLLHDKPDRALLFAYNFMGDIKLERDSIEQAEFYYFKAKEIAEKYGFTYDKAMNLASIADFYRDINKPKRAIAFADSALNLTKNNQYNMLTYEMYRTKSIADSLLGNISKAYANYQNYVYYRDLVHNEEAAKEFQRIEMQGEFDKKEAVFELELQRKKLQRNISIVGLLITLLFAGVFLLQRNRIRVEKDRSENLLLNILPYETAQELKQKGYADAQIINQVTVLFTDFKGFTQLSEKLSPSELVAAIHECFSAFDRITEKHKVEKIKTIGDAYMAAGGLPTENLTNSVDVVSAALEIQKFMQNHIAEKKDKGLPYFEIRIGVHTGPVVAGIVGIKKFQYDIWGDTVNTASRMESSGAVGKVNISEKTYQLVKDQFECEYRGEIEAKGKGKIGMYFVNKVI